MYKLHGTRSEKKRRRKIRLVVTSVVLVVLTVGTWASWVGVSRMLASQPKGVSEYTDSDCKTVSARGSGGTYREVCGASVK